ncbi:MAG: HupE/UreJ family protein, partial [Polymorphobacter sp.]
RGKTAEGDRAMIGRLLLLLLLLAAPVAADEFRPAYLQLTQTAPDSYGVLWKVPALDENTTLKIKPEFPPGTRVTAAPTSSYASGAAVQRWQISVPGGLDGKPIRFDGPALTRTDVLVRLARSDGSVQLERVMAIDPTFTAKASPGAFEVVRTYTVIGIEHILLGFDHLAFVLALVLIVRGTRKLLWTVTAFTLAHSITLALATLGVIDVPGPPVEAIIALSIVFVASEIVQGLRGREGLAARYPWLVAFSFGLLHGLGFAGALAEVGLPANSIPLALLFFNVGVEIGQLLFIAAVLAVTRLLWRLAGDRVNLRAAAIIPAYLIGGVASYWVIERIAKFWW